VAAPLLSKLALSVLPGVLLAVLGGALQATGHTILPVVAMLLGTGAKLLVESVLLVTPGVYLAGAPISTLVCTLTVLLIEWIALSRFLPFSVLAPKDLFRPLFATLPAVLLGLGLYRQLAAWTPGAWVILPVVAVVGLTVLFFALLLGAVERNDLLMLPMGERLCGFLERCKLLK
jgi:stage V sporulation protein B